MRNPAGIMQFHSLAEILCQSRVEALRIDFALQDVNLSKSHELELACRGVARRISGLKPERSGFAADYAATVFALDL
jgi:hypothetical protein